MSHGDAVSQVPDGFTVTGQTASTPSGHQTGEQKDEGRGRSRGGSTGS